MSLVSLVSLMLLLGARQVNQGQGADGGALMRSGRPGWLFYREPL